MPQSKKWHENVSSEQGRWTWAFVIVSTIACILIFLFAPVVLADEADDKFTALRTAYAEQERNIVETHYASPVSGLPAAAGGLVHSLNRQNEHDWEVRRRAVQQLGWMPPANESEYAAMAYWLSWSANRDNEHDVDVRNAAVNALAHLNANWNNIKAHKQ